MSKRSKPSNSMNWVAPGTIVALILGSGVSLWMQASGISSAVSVNTNRMTKTVPVSNTVTNKTVQHMAAPAVTKLELITSKGRVPARVKIGKSITLLARGYENDQSTVAKPVPVNFFYNGTAVPDCQIVSTCTFNPTMAGTYSIRISAANNMSMTKTIRVY